MRFFKSHNFTHLQMYINLYRSTNSLKKWQGKRLRRLVLHAEHNVPLWHDLFAAHEVDVQTIKTLSDLQKLPVTTKNTYTGKTNEERIDASRLIHGVWSVTSGSTARPFDFWMGDYRNCRFCIRLLTLRSHIWRGTSPRELQAIRVVEIRTTPEKDATHLGIPLQEYRDAPDGVLAKIKSFRPDVLESFAGVLFDVAKKVGERPDINLRIPVVISYGETLTKEMRRYIGRVFHAEVYDRYGLRETGPIAMECSRHHGEHIYNDIFIVEIVDDDGNPVAPGVSGKILVTDLYNYNMPFIRYDSGDRGRIVTEKCACGLSTPRLFIDGRVAVFFSFNGREVSQFELQRPMLAFGIGADVFQFQFVKKSESELELRIVGGAVFSPLAIPLIISTIQPIVGSAVQVSVVVVKEIAQNAQGKIPFAVDESLSPKQN